MLMNQLTKLFNDQILRIINTPDSTLFVAKDVCDILEIKNNRDAISRLDSDEKGVVSTDTPGGRQNLTTVNEFGLYSLVLSSRKPEAKQFKRWITHDVLPSIRKTGGYVANDDLFIQTYLSQADEQTKMLFKTTLQTIKKQNEQITTMKPKVLFADAVEASSSSVLVGELSKILKQNGINIGQNRLFHWLRENNYLIKKRGESYNLPTQKSMELGLFEIKKRTLNNPDGSIRTTRTTKVTGKGQIYFVNKFLELENAS
jgi:anti-repressor protein